MTYDEQRRLALQAEIQKLRAIARSFENLVRQVQAETAELKASAVRFESIVNDDVDAKIDALDKLAAERRRIAETKGDLRGVVVDITRTLGGL